MNNKITLSHRGEEPENGVLYVVGTPIGNLSDISFRALKILQKVFLIACEDTRQTKKIMIKYGISNNLISFNQNNSLSKVPIIINHLKDKKPIALVSDAGMPGICDPGEELIKEATLNGFNVICIPGPCAAITALVSSGLPSSRFIFEGFLPKKKSLREKMLFEISKNEKTTIFFEAPHRLKKTLYELKKYCGGSREIKVSKELTKKFEEHIGFNIDEVIDYFDKKEILGEFTIVVKGLVNSKKQTIDEFLLRKELNDLIKAGLSLSAASKYLAKKENLTKNVVYNLI